MCMILCLQIRNSKESKLTKVTRVSENIVAIFERRVLHRILCSIQEGSDGAICITLYEMFDGPIHSRQTNAC